MTGEGALIQALTLLREPLGRHALRQQALPADIGRLLGLLAGSPLKLDAAAGELGVPAGQLLEAVRFYAQQVLLYPAADARRVLGLNPDDDADVAKRHFRALQAWLHPDRAQGAEAVFASRVNTAWAACRHDTGATMAAHTGPAAMDPGQARLPRVPRWQRLESAGGWRSAQALVPLALLAACALMLWMATRPTPVPTLPEPMAAVTRSSTAVTTDDAPATTPATALESASKLPRQNTPHATTVARVASPSGGHAGQHGQRLPAVEHGEALALQMQRTQPGSDTAEPLRLLGQRPAVKPPPVKEASVAAPAAPRTADVSTAAASPAVSTHAAPPPALAEHTAGARQRAEALLAFLLRKKGAPPPIWRNARALESAEAARVVLTSGAMFRRPRAQESGVRWTLGDDEMRVRIPVIPADRDRPPHTVDATLQWHDQQWWISALTLETAP